MNEGVIAVDDSVLGEGSKSVKTGDDSGEFLVLWEIPSDWLVDDSETRPEDLVLVSQDHLSIFTDIKIDDLLSLEVSINDWGWNNSGLIVLNTNVASDSHSTLVVSSPGVQFSIREKTNRKMVSRFNFLDSNLIFIL